MKIYFAGYNSVKDILHIEGDFGVLTSYIEVKNKGVDVLTKPLILDSGAFSIASGRSNHTLDDYIKFLHKHKNKVKWYANLDVIGNAKETYDNQKEMEKQGLKPVPTFHYGSDYKWLKKYREEYDFVGLGGLVPYSKRKNKLYEHLNKCFLITKADIRTHGWGVTSPETLLKYPFYSTDSTSWLKFGAYGTVLSLKHNKLKCRRRRFKEQSNHITIGFEKGSEISLHNAKIYIKLQHLITKIWKQKGINWDSQKSQ